MEETMVPKWQRELKEFIGIKSGIILEGNVYDEFPIFKHENGQVEYDCTDNMEQTILSLVNEEQTEVFFFDPVDGFYCCHKDSTDTQKKLLGALTEGYSCCETERDHGCTMAMMPSSKKKGGSGNAEAEKYVWVSQIIRRAMAEKETVTDKDNLVFVLNFASRLEPCNLRASEANTMFMNLMAATTAVQVGNTIVMIVDKYNDIPAWVYLNNPNIRTISVCVPDRNTRRIYLGNIPGALSLYQVLSNQESDFGKRFVAETEGMKLQEIRQILQMAYRKDIEPENVQLAFRLYKYGVLDNPWEKLENSILTDIEKKLRERVKGQDDALEKVQTVISRAVKGLSGLQHSGASHKPKGILFFAGPTGVGKTETAKALAESIFGDENAYIRFDMSEYRLEQSDQKLFGAPPGYVGYEGGGQLTNAVKNKPFSVILFDEIEKASPTILDKFLQILEDGRMTDNQGNTVYFGESVIIFTSNIGLTKEVEEPGNFFRQNPHREPTIRIEDPMTEDTPEFRDKVTTLLTEGVKAYFNDNGRPELLNRLGTDNIVVFQFISKESAQVICDYKLKKICDDLKAEKGIEIDCQDIVENLRLKAVMVRENGGRGVGNMLESEFTNQLARFICTLPSMPTKLHAFVADDQTIGFEVA